jgi:hypothetical protein
MVSRSLRPAAVIRVLMFGLMLPAACLAAAEAEATQLTASWIDNSNGTAVTRLERRPATVGTFTAIADLPAGQTQYVDPAVDPDTTYCYRAVAYDVAGVSPYSDEACASPPAPVPPTLAFTNPANGATVSGPTTVSLSAGSGTGYTYTVKADGPTIYVGTNPSFTWNTTTTANGSHTLSATATNASSVTATALISVTVSNATGLPFTDGSGKNFAIAPTSPVTIKAVHILELRTAIDSLRLVKGLAAYSWTDPTLTVASTVAKRAHILDLRAALSAVCATAPDSCVAYTDPTLTSGHTVIKAAHLNELRANVVALR